MKKIFFTLPILAFAILLTYCAKNEASLVGDGKSTNEKAADRGLCNIEISASFAVQICGLATAVGACTACNNQTLYGSEIADSFNSEVFVPDAGKRFSVRNLSGIYAVDLKIIVGGVCQIWSIPTNGCIDFEVSESCVLTSSVPGQPC